MVIVASCSSGKWFNARSMEGQGMDDVVLLSRVQFAFTIMFHYLFPPLTIGRNNFV